MENIIARLVNVDIFQDNHKVLEKVNMHLYKGEFSYLIGRTGSGKSSLLKTLYGDLPLTKGRGRVADFDLEELDKKSIPLLRRKLGIVFQDFNLLEDRSVGDNLNFVLKATGMTDKKSRRRRVEEVLGQVELTDKLDKMPHELSGGEQQRVVIARALLNKPELILADEPTGNLDPQTSGEILELIRRVSKENNTAVLFATHDFKVIESFPARVVKCVDGHIIEKA